MAKILTGIVVSDKMTNTVVVDVQRKFQHPRFKKIVNIHKKFKVHAEDGSVKVGDVVRIQETKPISKDKHFILLAKGAENFSGKASAKEAPAKAQKEEVKEAAVAVEAPAAETKKTAAAKTTKKVPAKTVTKKKVTSSKK